MYADHEFVSSVTGDKSSNEGHCIETIFLPKRQEWIQCAKEWTSVVHPPDQFRHWCSALESGYDCMHFEFED